MVSKDTSDETNLSQTVLKALDVLECIALAEQPLSAAEVAKLCDLSRPTAYRLICTLAARGYVTEDDATHYRLGFQALSLSQNVLDSPGFARVSATLSAPIERCHQRNHLFIHVG